jgi:hypothetical protein
MSTKTMTAEERAAFIASLSPEQKKALLGELRSELTTEEQNRKDAYESLREDFLAQIKKRVGDYLRHGRTFKNWLRAESAAYADVLKDYGQLRRDDQLGFTLADADFRFHVKGARVKGFDERADVAAKRLTEFLREWVKNKEDGQRNPMYELAMMMIQRNEAGDLDYKSISRLYELEDSFADAEYSSIMQLFKESNTVEGTATHFYFEERDKNGKWARMEVSFNRL